MHRDSEGSVAFPAKDSRQDQSKSTPTGRWDVAAWAIALFVGLYLVTLTAFIVPLIVMRVEIKYLQAEIQELKQRTEYLERALGDRRGGKADLEEMSVNYRRNRTKDNARPKASDENAAGA
jgi:hypothetical protein